MTQSAGGKISLDVYHSAALTSVTGNRYDSNGKKQEFKLENGTASNFIISSGAYMNIHSGGAAEETTVVAGGKLVLSSGGTATKITLEENAVLSASVYGNDSKTVFSANYGEVEMIMQNGVAAGFVLENGGRLNVYDGGIASGVAIADKGSLYVDYMGSAATLYIADGGNVYVANEGRISDITIMDGGQLTLSTGAVLAGNITVDGLLSLEGAISFLGQTITIDLTDNKNGDAPLIENISFISDAVYSLKVNADATGKYVIASGALNFSDEVQLFDSNSVYIGTIENNTLKTDKSQYTLTENENGDLVLSVSANYPDSGITIYTVASFQGVSTVFELTGTGEGIIHSAGKTIDVTGAVNTSEWTLLGTGDFDGDGNDGILWLEKATGNVYMQNNLANFDEVNNKSNCLGTLSDGYSILTTGDFTGTGIDGALLQGPAFGDSSVSLNYGLPVWAREADGSTFPGWLGALVNTWKEGDDLKGDVNDLADINAKNYAYEVITTGDFNGDGVDDVMLQNIMPDTVNGVEITGSGDVFTFLTGDVNAIKAGAAPTVTYAGCATDGWEVIGAGDFDGDGTDDILLSDGTGIAGWKMVNGERTGDMWFGNLDKNQVIEGIGDFNGDNTDDLLIMNTASGEFSAWLVTGGTINGAITLA